MKNQTFGIEIETTGLGRERTAKAIAAYFGTQALYVNRHLGDWHIPMPDGRKWIVERDASVTDPAAEVSFRFNKLNKVNNILSSFNHVFC